MNSSEKLKNICDEYSVSIESAYNAEDKIRLFLTAKNDGNICTWHGNGYTFDEAVDNLYASINNYKTAEQAA